jgi:hypothetical protein
MVLAMDGLEASNEDLVMVSALVALTISTIARTCISNGINHLLEDSEEGLLGIMQVSMEFVERGA